MVNILKKNALYDCAGVADKNATNFLYPKYTFVTCC
jgi:hypothetical protein